MSGCVPSAQVMMEQRSFTCISNDFLVLNCSQQAAHWRQTPSFIVDIFCKYYDAKDGSVEKNVATWFCFEDWNCRNNVKGESTAGSTKNPMMRRRNWYSSVYMYAYDSAQHGAITVFEDDNC